MECLNEELKRREKCFRIFPDEKSYLRLFGAILHRFSEDWISRKRLSS
ncbi:transposase [Candidatus Cloacimonas acidaminovorans]